MLILEEINVVFEDMFVFVLYFYDRVFVNCVGLCVLGYMKDILDFLGCLIQWDKRGNLIGFLIVNFNVFIFYLSLGKVLVFNFDDQINFICYFMCELNRLGIISVIDVGGGF